MIPEKAIIILVMRSLKKNQIQEEKIILELNKQATSSKGDEKDQ